MPRPSWAGERGTGAGRQWWKLGLRQGRAGGDEGWAWERFRRERMSENQGEGPVFK